MSGNERPRVLILGGGFAGVGAPQKLKNADADVVLVDRHDYHTFQPLLYQLATGLLETTAVGHSLRDLLSRHDTTVCKARVTAIDLEARTAEFDEIGPIAYDYLVLGLGAEVNFFGTAGAPAHAFPMYTLPHATHLKDHLLGRWEAADRDPSLIADGALNVVVVGGGATGGQNPGAPAGVSPGETRARLRGNGAGAGPDRARRVGARGVSDVQPEPARVHRQGPREANRGG